MAIDPARFNAPATNGEVAQVSLHLRRLSFVVKRLAKAVDKISDQDLRFDINECDKLADEMEEHFNDLTGWVEPNDG